MKIMNIFKKSVMVNMFHKVNNKIFHVKGHHSDFSMLTMTIEWYYSMLYIRLGSIVGLFDIM